MIMKPRGWRRFAIAFAGSQALALACLDTRNSAFLRMAGYVLLLPATLLLPLLTLVFGENYNYYFVGNPLFEVPLDVAFFSVNGVFWLFVIRYFENRNSK